MRRLQTSKTHLFVFLSILLVASILVVSVAGRNQWSRLAPGIFGGAGEEQAIAGQLVPPDATADSDASPSSITVPKTVEVQAWIYPGPTTCSVERELETGAVVVDVLKPEYFTLGESGVLMQLLESDVGCNGYSTQNVALIQRFSKRQYSTVSGRIDAMRPFLRRSDRASAEQELVTFATETGFDGIEIDFEDFSSWTKQDYELYLQFVQSLGTKLQAAGKALLVAGPPVSDSIEEGYYPWRYTDFMSLPVEQVVVMAYDYQADHGNGEPVAPNFWVTNIIAYLEQKDINMSKVVIGIPSYGYTGTKAEHRSKLITLQEARQLSGFSQAVRDAASFEMKANIGNDVVFYQDQQSLQKKRQLIEDRGISAISVWHLGGNAWF